MKFGAGVRDFEAIGHPFERALEITEPIVVDARLRD